VDMFLYVLPVYLPFCQALLIHGMGRAVVFLLLAVLLLFMVAHKTDICRAIAVCAKVLSSLWLAHAPRLGLREFSCAFLIVPNEPSLTALFQRPPPFFT